VRIARTPGRAALAHASGVTGRPGALTALLCRWPGVSGDRLPEQQPRRVVNCDDFNSFRLNSVHNSVGAIDDFPKRRVTDFGNDTARFRE